MQFQSELDELATCDSFRERIELRAIADQRGRICSGSPGVIPRTRMSPQVGWISPVIRFIRVVLPEPLGPTRLVIPGGISQIDAIYPEHVAVETRDIVKTISPRGTRTSAFGVLVTGRARFHAGGIMTQPHDPSACGRASRRMLRR